MDLNLRIYIRIDSCEEYCSPIILKHAFIFLFQGDRVAIYMPMITELVVAMLACARIGAVHNIVFGGYSSDSLASRILDAKAKVIISADGAWRGKCFFVTLNFEFLTNID